MQWKIISRENAEVKITVQRDNNGDFMAGYIRMVKGEVNWTIELVPDAVYMDVGDGNKVCGIEILDEVIWKKFGFDENFLSQNPVE